MHFYGSASAEPFFVASFPENWGARLRISGGCPARGEPEALVNLCSSIACRAQPCQRCSPVLQALIYLSMHFYGSASAEPFFVARPLQQPIFVENIPTVKSAHDKDALFAFHTKYVIIYSCISFLYLLNFIPAERMWPLSKQSMEKALRKAADTRSAAAARRCRRPAAGSRCC